MTLPNAQKIKIEPLNQIFKSTSATYKFYWFYSLLQAIEENKTEITQEELIASMIANVWFSVKTYRLSFGVQDKLANIVDAISMNESPRFDFTDKTNSKEIIKGILNYLYNNSKTKLSKQILALGNYVPYRFLRPWCVDILKGVNDSKLEKTVKNYASDINEDKNLPYFFENGQIIFQKEWFVYFQKYIRICKGYCLWNLLEFLQKRNPNVPNIAGKLFPPNPKNRNLAEERKYWKIVYEHTEKPLLCIFSNELIQPNDYALDHFIPWSFVIHNQLWNLVPIVPSVNSSKSDKLPNLDLYFKKFANIQFEAFHIWKIHHQKRKLEDYLTIGNSIDEISQLSKNDFIQKLENQIKPLHQIAQNMGFQSHWTYKE